MADGSGRARQGHHHGARSARRQRQLEVDIENASIPVIDLFGFAPSPTPGDSSAPRRASPFIFDAAEASHRYSPGPYRPGHVRRFGSWPLPDADRSVPAPDGERPALDLLVDRTPIERTNSAGPETPTAADREELRPPSTDPGASTFGGLADTASPSPAPPPTVNEARNAPPPHMRRRGSLRAVAPAADEPAPAEPAADGPQDAGRHAVVNLSSVESSPPPAARRRPSVHCESPVPPASVEFGSSGSVSEGTEKEKPPKATRPDSLLFELVVTKSTKEGAPCDAAAVVDIERGASVPPLGRALFKTNSGYEAQARRLRRRRLRWGLAALAVVLCLAAVGAAVGAVAARAKGGGAGPAAAAPRPGRSAGERLVFEDGFDGGALDRSKWNVEVSAAGGGNWEFQVYTAREENLFVRDSRLHIRPTLTEDWLGDPRTHDLDLGSACTDTGCFRSEFYGCLRRAGPSGGIVNPVSSARINTLGKFQLTRGRVEVRARMPRGAWLWPAIWMLPADESYGAWPASGEIDIAESYGNEPGGDRSRPGSHRLLSTLHWGPKAPWTAYKNSQGQAARAAGSFADDFVTYGLVWTEEGVWTYWRDAAGVETDVLSFAFPAAGLWSLGDRGCSGAACAGWGWPAGLANPWGGRGKAAPFDRPFYLVINLAVGGTGGYWDDADGRPWANDAAAMRSFYDARGTWWAEWAANGDRSELQVESVNVWEL